MLDEAADEGHLESEFESSSVSDPSASSAIVSVSGEGGAKHAKMNGKREILANEKLLLNFNRMSGSMAGKAWQSVKAGHCQKLLDKVNARQVDRVLLACLEGVDGCLEQHPGQLSIKRLSDASLQIEYFMLIITAMDHIKDAYDTIEDLAGEPTDHITTLQVALDTMRTHSFPIAEDHILAHVLQLATDCFWRLRMLTVLATRLSNHLARPDQVFCLNAMPAGSRSEVQVDILGQRVRAMLMAANMEKEVETMRAVVQQGADVFLSKDFWEDLMTLAKLVSVVASEDLAADVERVESAAYRFHVALKGLTGRVILSACANQVIFKKNFALFMAELMGLCAPVRFAITITSCSDYGLLVTVFFWAACPFSPLCLLSPGMIAIRAIDCFSLSHGRGKQFSISRVSLCQLLATTPPTTNTLEIVCC